MRKNIIKKKTNSLPLVIGAIVCALVISCVVHAEDLERVTSIINNYYSGATVNQSVQSQPNYQPDNIGAVAAVGGICNGSEPTAQLCNVNAYELQIGTDLTVDDDLTVSGTATIASSYDGFFIQNAITVATGTVTTIYTNNTGTDLMCSRAAGAAYWNSTALSDSIKFSLGEATDVDLIATTTVATSTDTITAFGATTNFILESGNSIKAYLADYSPIASSTYYSNWTAEVGLLCRLIGG